MNDSRAAILSRVRQALTDVPSTETPADVAVRRDYLSIDLATLESRIELFVERVREYRARVERVETGTLREVITRSCERRGVRRLVVPLDIPDEWLPDGLTILRDPLLTNEHLNESDGVLTGCALGIAQTGTIVLDRGRHQGRRALTLLPDYHICVVFEHQIVGIVPEAIRELEGVASMKGRPMTWISGPSATSDIELNRVEGVHGPRTLEVLVVSG